MEIDVYDTYTKSNDGFTLHFDVFIKRGTHKDSAFKYAKLWLSSIGENPESLNQSRCNFCHSEQANPVVQKALHENGHYILQMEGCPNPI